MNTLFFLDIDATLADIEELVKTVGPEPSRADKTAYLEWLTQMVSTEILLNLRPVVGMVDLSHCLRYAHYLTSREEKWREVSQLWLLTNGFAVSHILMRPNDDWRSSADFKEATILKMLHEVRLENAVIFDDDADGELEKVCKRRGWTLLKAVSGGNPSK